MPNPEVRPQLRPYYHSNKNVDEESINHKHVLYNKNNEICLYNYKDIPRFLNWNPYIRNGYRVYLPFNLCLKSLFIWNNESINIWSHLLGFVLFFVLMMGCIVITIPYYHGHFSDHVIMSFGLLCFQYCMLCSTGFHVFGCHSERSCKWWFGVDMGGISIGVIGCYIPAVYYAFYCMSLWRNIYISIICLLTAATLILQRSQLFTSKRGHKLRLVMYISLTACGVIPSAHWVYLNGGFSASIVQMFIPKVVVLYILGLIALVFYVSKFPERISPGMFDIVGSSHQCWHFVIVTAFIWCYKSGIDIFIYRITNTCV